jgi:hypothetical protein
MIAFYVTTPHAIWDARFFDVQALKVIAFCNRQINDNKYECIHSLPKVFAPPTQIQFASI